MGVHRPDEDALAGLGQTICLAVQKEQRQHEEGDEQVEGQHRAEGGAKVQSRRDDDLEEAEHEELPVDAVVLGLVHDHNLQVDQQVGDGQQLTLAPQLVEIDQRKSQGGQGRDTGDGAIQTDPANRVGEIEAGDGHEYRHHGQDDVIRAHAQQDRAQRGHDGKGDLKCQAGIHGPR